VDWIRLIPDRSLTRVNARNISLRRKIFNLQVGETALFVDGVVRPGNRHGLKTDILILKSLTLRSVEFMHIILNFQLLPHSQRRCMCVALL
jgi:hypothetical protein